MSVDHEVILEFSKMVTEHTASLWKIASAFVVLEIVIIAHVLLRTRAPFRNRVVGWLSASTAANVLSLICGYLADAGLLYALKVYAEGQPWHPSREAEVFNALQMLALTVGLGLFVWAFVSNSRILADNLIRAGAHATGQRGEDGHE